MARGSSRAAAPAGCAALPGCPSRAACRRHRPTSAAHGAVCLRLRCCCRCLSRLWWCSTAAHSASPNPPTPSRAALPPRRPPRAPVAAPPSAAGRSAAGGSAATPFATKPRPCGRAARPAAQRLCCPMRRQSRSCRRPPPAPPAAARCAATPRQAPQQCGRAALGALRAAPPRRPAPPPHAPPPFSAAPRAACRSATRCRT
eukprot:131904-Chlamydomonas_euryale.AAC.6